ncbi:MAG: helix-turn-helix domain-containing protein [Ruminococcaceae bacterium]|nr:helix-turn-helix domain-containing protein [Oscillospiraceae bacterium]
MDYIKRIKKIKSEKKMTNDELAERTGIPGGTLSKILAGISESPKLSNFVAICEALNCSLDYIMYGIEENSNNYTLDEEEIDLVERFRTLDNRGKDTVMGVLEREEAYARGEVKTPAKRARILTPEPLRSRLAAAYESSDNGFKRLTLPLYDLPVSAGVGVALDEESTEEITVSDNSRTREADFALRISGNSMEPRYRDGDILLVQETDTLEFGELGIFILDGSGFFKVFGGDRLYSLNPEYGDILLKDFEDARIAGRVIGKLKKR